MSSHWKRHQRCHSGYVKMSRGEWPTKQRGGVWWLSPEHLKKGSRRGGCWVWQTLSVANLNFISLQREKLAYPNRDRQGVRTKKDFTHTWMPGPKLFNLDVRSFHRDFRIFGEIMVCWNFLVECFLLGNNPLGTEVQSERRKQFRTTIFLR